MLLRTLGSAWFRFVNKSKGNVRGDFYSCIKWPLFGYRYFGVFPVDLRGNDDGNNVIFKWVCPYFILINMPFLITQAIISGIYCYDTIYYGLITFPVVSLTVNYFCGLMTSLLLLRLAKYFKKIYKKILSIERKLPPIKTTSNILQFIPAILIFGCIGSIIQILMNSIYLYRIAIKCTPQDEIVVIKTYFDYTFVSVFRYLDFSYVAAVIFQIIKVQSGILPTLNNALMIACSAYLENRFDNLNDIIAKEQKNAMYMDWGKIKKHYIQLTKLVRIIDRNVNPIVLLSFFVDLYNLCLQCYYFLSRQSYYYLVNYSDCIQGLSNHLQVKFNKPFAVTFTFSKIIIVSILCARLHTSSRVPLNCLHTVSQAAYNYEAHRFMEQVYHSKVALSGFGFFYITKDTIITVLGILVTYELVLLQFK